MLAGRVTLRGRVGCWGLCQAELDSTLLQNTGQKGHWWLGMLLFPPLVPQLPPHPSTSYLASARKNIHCELGAPVLWQRHGECSHSDLAPVQTSLALCEPRASHEWAWMQLGEAFRHALFISVGVICLSCAYAPSPAFVWLLSVSRHPPMDVSELMHAQTCRSCIL